jgi:glycine hydroxymethyltransferase
MSGMWFDIIPYGVNKETNLIDYDQVEKLAQEHKPKLIIAGFSAYSRKLDWERFSKIAKSVNAILMADIAHVAGLIACNLYPSPVGHADIITSTTHKTLRGPRGGIIMTNNEEYYKKINSAIFPGLQGGPLMHIIAGKAVASQECLSPNFIEYSKQVILNSQALSAELIKNGLNILTGGTDNHLCIIDLRSLGIEINGDLVEKELEKVNIICNKNLIPNDPLPSTKTSGIRLGTPACTTRGFKQEEFIEIGKNIATIIENLKNFKEVKAQTRELVLKSNQNLTEKFKIYQ